MAKATKTTEETTEPISNENEKSTEIIPEEQAVVEEPVIEDKAVEEPKVVTESDEVIFLRHILSIQHVGGWGNHLTDIINDRIKSLQS